MGRLTYDKSGSPGAAEGVFQSGDSGSHYAGIYGVHDIIDLIGVYLHADIEESLSWAQDPFITALAILDRRCGKRRLQKYANWDYTGDPDWLKRIYQIRFETEGIPYHKNYITDLKHSQLI